MKCPECGALVYDAYTTKQRINLMYQMNTNVGWAKNELKIIIGMLEDRLTDESLEPVDLFWLVDDLNKIMNGLETIGEKESKKN